jgi:magnesium transporter
MDYFTKRYHPPGTSPGTLSENEDRQKSPLVIKLIDYTESDFAERELPGAAECVEYLHRPTITWIHVQGSPEPATLRQFGETFGLHVLALEDVSNIGQRPKYDSFDDALFVIMSLQVSSNHRLSSEQVSLFLGENYVISFHDGRNDPFEPVRKRLRAHSGRIRSRSSDYLFYALLDLVIDQGFPMLEWFGDEIERLEEEVMSAPERSTLSQIHEIKREMLLIRRMVWPHREIVNALLRDEHVLIREETKLYLRDCYDHTVQIIELLETYRDMAAGMMDVYLSSISNRLNEVMRVLTIIATIFIPLTFIVGVYGMNFGNKSDSPWAMPELNWYYGYPAVLLLMLVVAVAMLAAFRRKRWF